MPLIPYATIFACRWIWNERAFTQCPEPIHPFYFQVRINSDPPSFSLAWNTIKDRILAVYDSKPQTDLSKLFELQRSIPKDYLSYHVTR